MGTHHNFKISVWPHVIETTEEFLDRTQLLLSQLAKRSRDLACKIGDAEDSDYMEMRSELQEFLFEMDHSFFFMCDAIEAQGHHLYKLRQKEINTVISKHSELKQVA